MVADRISPVEYAALLDLDVPTIVEWATLSTSGLSTCLDVVLAGGFRLRSDVFQAAARHALHRGGGRGWPARV